MIKYSYKDNNNIIIILAGFNNNTIEQHWRRFHQLGWITTVLSVIYNHNWRMILAPRRLLTGRTWCYTYNFFSFWFLRKKEVMFSKYYRELRIIARWKNNLMPMHLSRFREICRGLVSESDRMCQATVTVFLMPSVISWEGWRSREWGIRSYGNVLLNTLGRILQW